MSDSEQGSSMSGDRSELNNPIRYSLRDNWIDITEFGIDVTAIDIKPSEGNVYIHWEEDDG